MADGGDINVNNNNNSRLSGQWVEYWNTTGDQTLIGVQSGAAHQENWLEECWLDVYWVLLLQTAMGDCTVWGSPGDLHPLTSRRTSLAWSAHGGQDWLPGLESWRWWRGWCWLHVCYTSELSIMHWVGRTAPLGKYNRYLINQAVGSKENILKY